MPSVPRGAPSRRRSKGPQVAVAALVAIVGTTGSARAQLTPSSAHNGTMGPGTGLTASVSPTGALAASVPLNLPSARGGIPVPLSIQYRGGPRASEFGVGWHVPEYYVEISDSQRRRKPATDEPAMVPERVTVNMAGASALMVPRSDVTGVWVPSIGDSYQELVPVPEGWELRTATGIIYTFGRAAIGGHRWDLSSIEDRARHDRVELQYEVRKPCAASPNEAETDLVAVRYGKTPSGGFLYQIELDYGGWLDDDTPPKVAAFKNCNGTGATREGIFGEARSQLVTRVRVTAANNLVAGSPRHRIRAYDFTYDADPLTREPLLVGVDLRGESDPAAGGPPGDPALPVARYAYGSVATGTTGLQFSAATAIERNYAGSTNYVEGISDSVSETHDLGTTWEPDGRLTWTRARHVIRDFTGDNIPDLVFKQDSHWTLVPGTIEPGAGVSFTGGGQTYTWDDFGEISLQATFHPPGNSDERHWREAGVVAWTDVDFMDWNADGLMDVVDATYGSSPDTWRVWINRGLSGNKVLWRGIDVPVANLRVELGARGIRTLNSLLPATTDWSDRLPLTRSRTWPRYSSETCAGRVYYNQSRTAWTATGCTTPASPTDRRHSDTITEWLIRDLNGDGFPDFDAQSGAVLECEHDYKSGVCDSDAFQYPWDIVVGLVYECRSYHAEQLSLGQCPSDGAHPWSPAPSTSPGTGTFAILNTAGAFDPAGDVFATTPASAFASCPGWWTNGVDVLGQPFQPEASFELCGMNDVTGQGIPAQIGWPEAANAPEYPGQASFTSDRLEACDSPAGYYTSRQVSGYADINGDGIPDFVSKDADTDSAIDPDTGGLVAKHYTGKWHVRFGTAAGLLKSSWGLPDDFELALSSVRCDEDGARTIAGLLDVDGDGTPEMVSTLNGQLLARRLVATSEAAAGVTAGRLTSITNGDGATTSIEYQNNKANGIPASDQSLPFPEIVVSTLRMTVPAGHGDPVAPLRFAYGIGHLYFDPVFSRWSFPGYQRQITLTGIDRAGAVDGQMSIVDRTPVPGTSLTWADSALAARPHISTLLEGTFWPDPRPILSANVMASPQLRGQSITEWNVVPLPTSGSVVAGEDCGGAIGATGQRAGDPALCHRAGIVYQASVVSWSGTHAPPATDNLATAMYVTQVDDRGRPLQVMSMGDTRRTTDDVCSTITWAQPTDSDDRVTTAPAIMRTNDCGWGYPIHSDTTTTAGSPVTIAGTRFAYDNLPEGQIGAGLVTQRIIERYDVASGTWLGQRVDASIAYDGVGNVTQIDRSRLMGTAATNSTFIAYDPWAATPVSTTVIATGALPIVATMQSSVWPEVAEVSQSPNGERSTSLRDRFGRPVGTTVTNTAGASYVLATAAYDDTPGAREILTTSYGGDVAVGSSTTSGPVERRHTRLDALGRAAVSWRELGSDYTNILVESSVRFDTLGRAVYSADPYPATAPPAIGTGDGHDGTMVTFDAGGRVTRTVRARNHTAGELATATDRSQDIYVTSCTYEWRNGELVVTSRNADDNDPTSPRASKSPSSQTRTDATGHLVESTRWEGATPVDRVQHTYDRLDHAIRLRRFADPAGASQPVDWIDVYDSLGQRTSSTEPGLGAVSAGYDEWGALVTSTWVDGGRERTARTSFDGLGRATLRELVSRQLPSPEVIEWTEKLTYDHVVDGSLQSGKFLGRLATSEVPGVAMAFYGYDAFGNVSSQAWKHADETAAWSTLTITTAGGMPTAIDYYTPKAKDRAEYTYDSAGRTKLVKFGPLGGTSVAVFSATTIDPLGRYRAVKLGNGATEEYDYRDIGNRELTRERAAGQDGFSERKPSGFDAFGRVTVLDETSQVPGAAVASNHSTYAYDTLGRLTSAITTGTNPAADLYTFDALGNVRTHRDTLTGAGSQDFSVDQVDPDRACKVAGPGLATGACNIAYDGGGNVLTTEVGSASPRNFLYDAGSRVTRINRGAITAKFVYGPGGMTARQQSLNGSAIARDLRWYGSALRNEINTNGATFDERTVMGPLGVVALARGSGAARQLIYPHGNMQANRLFTGTGGKTTEAARYRPYGALQTSFGVPGSATYSDFQWNGGQNIDTLGVVMLGARPYDPIVGRFLQRDPFAITSTATHGNPYAFAGNDPVNFADPSGLSPDWSSGGCMGQECGGLTVGFSTGMGLMPLGGLYSRGIGHGSSAITPPTGNGAGAAATVAGLPFGLDADPRFLEHVDGTPWARDGNGRDLLPSLDDIHQGKLPDCAFVAALVGVTLTHPQEISRFIADGGNGTYTVRLPGLVGEQLVNANFRAGFHMWSGDRGALWPLLLEKGLMQSYLGVDRFIERALDGEGVDAAAAIRIVGHGDSTEITPRDETPEALLGRLAEARRLERLMIATSNDERSASAGQHILARMDPAYMFWHAYAIIDVDRSGGRVKLFNSWGSHHPNQDGWTSVAVLQDFFESITIEE